MDIKKLSRTYDSIERNRLNRKIKDSESKQWTTSTNQHSTESDTKTVSTVNEQGGQDTTMQTQIKKKQQQVS